MAYFATLLLLLAVERLSAVRDHVYWDEDKKSAELWKFPYNCFTNPPILELWKTVKMGICFCQNMERKNMWHKNVPTDSKVMERALLSGNARNFLCNFMSRIDSSNPQIFDNVGKTQTELKLFCSCYQYLQMLPQLISLFVWKIARYYM